MAEETTVYEQWMGRRLVGGRSLWPTCDVTSLAATLATRFFRPLNRYFVTRIDHQRSAATKRLKPTALAPLGSRGWIGSMAEVQGGKESSRKHKTCLGTVYNFRNDQSSIVTVIVHDKSKCSWVNRSLILGYSAGASGHNGCPRDKKDRRKEQMQDNRIRTNEEGFCIGVLSILFANCTTAIDCSKEQQWANPGLWTRIWSTHRRLSTEPRLRLD